ncbi:MAG: Abi family protein [Xanthomonadales bacterium]|nr:Abi family protein [Xanthomonadales bacterium]
MLRYPDRNTAHPSLSRLRYTGGFFIGPKVSTYARPHLSFVDQLALLKSRGLTVSNDATALSYLRRLGYYRLSAYWYPFRKREMKEVDGKLSYVVYDAFQPGSTFQAAVDLYVFDKKLRMLVMDGLERVEVAIRVDIAHHLGQLDTFAHTRAGLLHGDFAVKLGKSGKTAHSEWLAKHDSLIERSKEDFVSHYKAKHGLPLPVWVAIEVWDFGLLSHFFAGMKYADKAALAQRFGVPDPGLMESWLRTLNYLRNIAAHHSRLWNRNMVDQPKMPKVGQIPVFDACLPTVNVSRPYATLCILSFLMRQICPSSTWQQRVKALMQAFPTVAVPRLEVAGMGCHKGWDAEAFWT